MQGAGGPPPPPAQPGMAPQGGTFAMKFRDANVTHDGRLTLQQAQDAHMGAIVKHFAAIDRDNKGYVTLQDIHAWHHESQAARMGQAPGSPYPGTPAYPPPPAQGGQPY
jgi:hypothetical protein